MLQLIFYHQHPLIVGGGSQTETYVSKFLHLQCKQLYRVLHLNPKGIEKKKIKFNYLKRGKIIFLFFISRKNHKNHF
jgi:hypothetical protein